MTLTELLCVGLAPFAGAELSENALPRRLAAAHGQPRRVRADTARPGRRDAAELRNDLTCRRSRPSTSRSSAELSAGALDILTLADALPSCVDLCAAASFGGSLSLTSSTIEPDTTGGGFAVTGTCAWGGFDAVTVTLHVDADEDDIVAQLTVQLPPEIGARLPGVDWLAIDHAWLGFATAPARLLGDPPLVRAVSESLGAVVEISGVAVPIVLRADPGGQVTLTGDFAAIAFPSLSHVVAFLGHTDDVHLPAGLDGFTLALHDLSATFDVASSTVSSLGVSIGADPSAPPWQIVPGVFAISAYEVGLRIDNPTVAAQRRVGGLVSASLLLGGTTISVAALHPPSGGWQFEGRADTIAMKPLVDDLGTRFGVTMPAALESLRLERVDIGFDTATHEFHAACACTFTVGETPIELDASVRLTKPPAAGNGAAADAPTAPTAYFVVADGALHIGAAQFDVHFADSAEDRQLTASWQAGAGSPLDFAHVAATFGLDLAGVPAELLPQLVEVSFTYDFTKRFLMLTAMTEHVATVLVSMPDAAGTGRVFAALLGLGLQVGVRDLPLVGPALADVADLKLDACQLLVTSAPMVAADIAAANALLAAASADLPTFPAPTAPAKDITRGVRVALVLEVGGVKRPPVSFDLTAPATAPPATAPPATSTERPAADAPAAEPGGGAPAPKQAGAVPAKAATTPGAWLDVQKSFGPVTLQRIGAGYRDSRVWLMLDASLVTSGLSVGLHGLGLGFTLQLPPKVRGRLDGLDISFEAGPVSISGGFLEVERPDGVEYDGEALIKAASFTLSAIGSYMTMNDGHTSMFVFAILDIPLGGPPIFFITGLAAGFGYNRGLRVPTLDELPAFPLVAAAMAGSSGTNPFNGAGDNAGKALAVLDDYITPSVGEDWLAVGVRFTSFEIVQSFAMIMVQFGTHFELDLLGLSNLAMPPDVGEDVEPIAFAQLALEATINPDAGIFGIAAKLTAESFVLSKACHLTGGFAFYMWMKDNPTGDPRSYHAGDFVITLGGYSPFFDVPKFYPVVPRLGMNWTISQQLGIKGGLYFALTSGAVMAGGYLEAIFEAGPLRAWFKVEADFLLGWKPFHYYIRLELSLGFSLHVKVLFVDFTITIELGVGLELWGPTFAGKIHVSLLIVSFTISFGDSNPKPQPISWREFATSFLPPPTTDAAPPGQVRAAAVQSATSYCSSRFTGGVLRDARKDKVAATDPDWIVNAERFELLTNSAIPAHSPDAATPLAVLVSGDGASATATTPVSVSSPPPIGVGPVAIDSADFTSLHHVTVLKVGAGGAYEYGYDFAQRTIMTAATGPVPRAAWSVAAALAPSMGQVNDPAGPNIAAAVTGISFAARHLDPDVTVPIDVGILMLEQVAGPRFSWTAATVPSSDAFTASTWRSLAGTPLDVGAPAATAARNGIVAALVGRGLLAAPRIDLSGLDHADVFTGEPVLRLLGEEVQR